MNEVERLRKALMFYANYDNYWSVPLMSPEDFDKKTLRIVRESAAQNAILIDRGELARNALWPNGSEGKS